MWVPAEKCMSCGGTTIREHEDTAEWRCLDCGEICEEWAAERPAAAPARKPVTVATLLAELRLIEAGERRQAIIRGEVA